MAHAVDEFEGNDRFRILRRLGAGGYGVVYEALDATREERVALKTLRWADPAAIYRLKREFRVLTDVIHPNLVTLHELFVDGAKWFYTMELVEGVEFSDYFRRVQATPDAARSAVRQLAEGVAAIHSAGMLHRDLKPSNVLVTDAGRVVILDFGIVRELTSAQAAMQTIEEGAFGTAAYMAPEQAVGEPVEASDWYAVGTMIYESLTGTLPYSGTAFKILSAKQTRDAPPIEGPARAAFPELADVATRLLERDPASRLAGNEVLTAVGAAPAAAGQATLPGSRLLAGRSASLEALREAFAAVQAGGSSAVVVTGVSGIGKSALVQSFLEDPARRAATVVLPSRCYVRESVPYKGVDGIIDSLSRFMRSLTREAASALLTDDVSALVRLFPVLARVDVIGERAEANPDGANDPVELRRRAFAALRALMSNLTKQWKLVLWIDDFQWTDADSLALLDALLAQPGTPALMFIATVRREALGEGTMLTDWLGRARVRGILEIDLRPIEPTDAASLALAYLGEGLPDAERTAERIAREAGGSPFLVEQLARFALSSADTPAAHGLTLTDMLAARIARLPAGAAELFEVVAAAGRPISIRTAGLAAQLAADPRPLVTALRAEHLVRSTTASDRIEPYHDRLREACTSTLSPEKHDALHLRLALALELQESDDVEALYEHFSAAGRPADASRYAEQAAGRAAEGLAFERAALLYRRAIDLRTAYDATQTTDATLSLQVGLADALANSGRGAAAADAYLAAATLADADRAVDLKRRAAEELLRSGHVDRGLAVLDGVFKHVGLTLAASPRRALLRLLMRRALLRIRGLKFRERRAEELDNITRQRLDTCWAAALGLARVDNIRAADIQSLNLLLSLKAGEPTRIGRALAAEYGFLSTAGPRVRKRVEELERVTVELCERIQNPHATGMSEFASGVVHFYRGEFAASFERTERAEATFRDRCVGAAWELTTVQTYSLGSLFYLGRWPEMVRRVPLRLSEARERGDLYASADVAAGRSNVSWLLADDVPGARTAYREAMDRWTPRGFHFQHYVGMLAMGNIDLYDGDAGAAWARLVERWPALRRSMLLRLPFIRIEARHLRARCALALAAVDTRRNAYLRSAERDAKAMLTERCLWGDGLAYLTLATVAALRGSRDEESLHYQRAQSALEESGLHAFATIGRCQFGRRRTGAEAAAEVESAEAWLRAAGAAQPNRICNTFAPGVPA